MNVKNIDLYKRVLEAEKKEDSVIGAPSNASTTRDSI